MYCVSLQRSVDRRRLMEKQVQQMRLQAFEFVDAVDARALTLQALAENGLYNATESLRWHQNGLTLNEVACSLSHAECYRKIVNAGHERAIILEDDVLFRTRRLRRLAADDIPEWADIVFLNSFMSESPPLGNLSGPYYGDASYHGSSAAYLLTKNSARLLLEASVPVVHAADGLLGRALALQTGQVHAFRNKGSALSLRSVLVFPEAVTNGSTEHYYRSSIR